MPQTNLLTHYYTKIDKEDVEQLSQPSSRHNIVEVRPPLDRDVPSTLDWFVKNILEIQSKWLGIKNTSPTTTFEITRLEPQCLKFQFCTETKRLERKIQKHLSDEIPGIKFQTGNDKLSIKSDVSIGGGLLTLGRSDFFPLETKFQRSPMDSIAASLHPHAIPQSKFIIQVLFRPIAGRSLKRLRWIRRAHKHISYLKKTKPDIHPWHNIEPEKREKRQASSIKEKADKTRYKASIRILILNSGKHVKSHLKEIAGGFNIYESDLTGQYLDLVTIKTLFQNKILNFAEAVRKRSFQNYTVPFYLTPKELAGLVALPNNRHENISYAEP